MLNLHNAQNCSNLQINCIIDHLPGGSNKLSDWSGGMAALAVIGLALALVTGVTADPPLAVTLVMAVLVASLTSLNLSINYNFKCFNQFCYFTINCLG